MPFEKVGRKPAAVRLLLASSAFLATAGLANAQAPAGATAPSNAGSAGATAPSNAGSAGAAAPSDQIGPAPIVFFDIAGPDAAVLSEFYRLVFGWSVDAGGAFSLPVTAPLQAQVRRDPAEKRLYIGVPDVAAALELIAANGGSVDAPRFEVPGVVVLGLFRDPAGNPMGLVELENGRTKIP